MTSKYITMHRKLRGLGKDKTGEFRRVCDTHHLCPARGAIERLASSLQTDSLSASQPGLRPQGKALYSGKHTERLGQPLPELGKMMGRGPTDAPRGEIGSWPLDSPLLPILSPSPGEPP